MKRRCSIPVARSSCRVSERYFLTGFRIIIDSLLGDATESMKLSLPDVNNRLAAQPDLRYT